MGFTVHRYRRTVSVCAVRHHLWRLRRLFRWSSRCGSHAICRVRRRPAISAVHDPFQDRFWHRSWRERHIAHAHCAGPAGLARHGKIGSRAGPADQGTGLHRSRPTTWRQRPLPDIPSHTTQHHGCHPRHFDVRDPLCHFYRGVPVFHWHGRCATNALLGIDV